MPTDLPDFCNPGGLWTHGKLMLILYTTHGGLSLLPLPYLLEGPSSLVCQYVTQRAAGEGDVPVGCMAPVMPLST